MAARKMKSGGPKKKVTKMLFSYFHVQSKKKINTCIIKISVFKYEGTKISKTKDVEKLSKLILTKYPQLETHKTHMDCNIVTMLRKVFESF